MRIAQNPRNNVLDIFGLAKADTSYQPTLASAPPDWTLTLTYLVATPSISLGTGSYIGTQEVAISDATAGSAIHYTTDGTVPNSSSPLYAGPLSITVSTTVQAIAILQGSPSAIASSILTITAAHAPVKLAFLQQPSNALTGATISPAVQVAVEDSSGNCRDHRHRSSHTHPHRRHEPRRNINGRPTEWHRNLQQSQCECCWSRIHTLGNQPRPRLRNQRQLHHQCILQRSGSLAGKIGIPPAAVKCIGRGRDLSSCSGGCRG